MRKLKFRVWSSKYNSYIDTAPEFVLGLAGEIISNYGDLDNKEYIVEQFTGLVDMEGKDIFEGDIVRYIQPKTVLMSYPNGEGNEAEVKFLNDGGKFGFFVVHETYCWGINGPFCKEAFLVTGNIHEKNKTEAKEKE